MNRAIRVERVRPPIIKQQYDRHTAWHFEHKWKTDLCSCKPMSRCCFACFCSCCMGCKLAKYLGEASIIGCCPCSLAYLRTKLRTARRIEGDCCDDLCIADCCGACAATQMANELESQGLWDVPKAQEYVGARHDRSYTYTYSN